MNKMYKYSIKTITIFTKNTYSFTLNTVHSINIISIDEFFFLIEYVFFNCYEFKFYVLSITIRF